MKLKKNKEIPKQKEVGNEEEMKIMKEKTSRKIMKNDWRTKQKKKGKKKEKASG